VPGGHLGACMMQHHIEHNEVSLHQARQKSALQHAQQPGAPMGVTERNISLSCSRESAPSHKNKMQGALQYQSATVSLGAQPMDSTQRYSQ
jgi:hypothetical protein